MEAQLSRRQQEKAEKRARDMENKRARIELYTKVAVITDRKCNICEWEGEDCYVWPEGYPHRTKTCLRCVKTSHKWSKCQFPPENSILTQPETTNEIKTNTEATGSGSGSKVIEKLHTQFPAHTKEWYRNLSGVQQKRYLHEQIQAAGKPKTGGPCTNCILRRIPCREVHPESAVYEFYKGGKCGGCHLEEPAQVEPVEGVEGVVRRCIPQMNISHIEHEADIPKVEIWSEPTNWKDHLFQSNMTLRMQLSEKDSIQRELQERVEELEERVGEWEERAGEWEEMRKKLEEKCKKEKKKTQKKLLETIQSFEKAGLTVSSDEFPSDPSPFTPEILRLHNMGMNLDKLYTGMHELDSIIEALAVTIRSELVLVFEEPNIRQLERFSTDRGKERDLDIMDALAYLLRVTEKSAIQPKIQELGIQNLECTHIIRGVVCAFLLTTIFGHPSTPIQNSQMSYDFVHKELLGSFFGYVRKRSLSSHPMIIFAKGVVNIMSMQLYATLRPLLLVAHGKIDEHLENDCKLFCTEVCKVACRLDMEIKLNPSFSVELFPVFSGVPFKPFFHEGMHAVDKSAELMLMFGAKVRGSVLTEPYVKAKAVFAKYDQK